MTSVSLSTAERIEPVPGGVKRTTLVVLTVDGIRFVTETADAKQAAQLIVQTSRALGIGRGDVDASEDVPA